MRQKPKYSHVIRLKKPPLVANPQELDYDSSRMSRTVQMVQKKKYLLNMIAKIENEQ